MQARAARIIGFAFDRTWMNVLFLIPLVSASATSLPEDAQSVTYAWESCFCALALFVVAIATTALDLSNVRLNQKMPERTVLLLRYVGGILASLGILVFWLLDNNANMPLPLVAGALMGVGEAILLIQWGKAFSKGNNAHLGIEIALIFIIGGIVAIGIGLLSPMIRLAIAFPMPFFSSFFVVKSDSILETADEAVKTNGSNGESKELPDVVDRFVFKLSIAVFIASFLMSLYRSVFPTGSLFGPLFPAAPAFAGIVCMAIVWWQLYKSNHCEYRYVYRSVFTFIFIGMALFFFMSDYSICDLIARAGLFAFEFFFFVSAINIVSNFNILPEKVFSYVEFGYIGSEFLGIVVIEALRKSELAFLPEYGVFAIVFVALFVVYTFVFTESDMIYAEGWGLYGKSNMQLDSTFLSDPAENSEPPESENLVSAVMETQAARLASKYDLSPREEEVLVCLLLGMGRKKIQEKLYISLGTVNTHISHIYTKIGIHSRDELIDLID